MGKQSIAAVFGSCHSVLLVGFKLDIGGVTFKDGECIDEICFDNDSKEAIEFAADMWGIDLEEEGFVFNEKSGTYERQDMDIAENPTMG